MCFTARRQQWPFFRANKDSDGIGKKRKMIYWETMSSQIISKSQGLITVEFSSIMQVLDELNEGASLYSTTQHKDEFFDPRLGKILKFRYLTDAFSLFSSINALSAFTTQAAVIQS